MTHNQLSHNGELGERGVLAGRISICFFSSMSSCLLFCHSKSHRQLITCSASCGGGTMSRNRVCNNGCSTCQCVGAAAESQACNAQPCCTWTAVRDLRWGSEKQNLFQWSSWSTCSVTCGTGGAITRSRQCSCGSGVKPCLSETPKYHIFSAPDPPLNKSHAHNKLPAHALLATNHQLPAILATLSHQLSLWQHQLHAQLVTSHQLVLPADMLNHSMTLMETEERREWSLRLETQLAQMFEFGYLYVHYYATICTFRFSQNKVFSILWQFPFRSTLWKFIRIINYTTPKNIIPFL